MGAPAFPVCAARAAKASWMAPPGWYRPSHTAGGRRATPWAWTRPPQECSGPQLSRQSPEHRERPLGQL